MQAFSFRNVVIWLAVLFTAYDAFTRIVQPRILLDAIDAGDRDVIIAERYYLAKTPRAVLIGSSMASRLGRRSGGSEIDEGFANLGLDGEGPLTGLELLLQRGDLPRTVFVEINWTNRPTNIAIVDAVADQPMRAVRMMFPATRMENRPVNLLTARALREPDHPVIPDADQLPPDREPSTIDKSLAYTTRQWGDLTPERRAAVNSATDEMIRKLDRFVARGTRVVFVWMPMHPALAATPFFSYLRQHVRDAFPPSRFRWVDGNESDKPFLTFDTIHMTEASAFRFTQLLARVEHSEFSSNAAWLDARN